MQLERLNFREFSDGKPIGAASPAKKFLASGKPQEMAPPPPPPVIITEADVKAAEREGYKKGFLEGTQEGRKQAESEQAAIDRGLSAALENLMRSVAPIFADYRQAMTGIRQQVPQVALAIARKVAGRSLADNAAAVVEDMALRCCELMIHEPKLTVTVHDSLGDALEKRLQSLAARQQTAADIVVVRDGAVEASHCRVEWKHGIMERDPQKLWENIEQAVGALADTAKRETEQQMDQLQASTPAASE